MNQNLTALRTYCTLAHSGTPSALLAPSTEVVFDWLARNVLGEGSTAVGHGALPGMETPAALLARLQQEPAALPRRVIIFTDQLVSARDATIEVRRDGKTLFLSPLEFILNNQYRYPLYAVNGGGLASLMDAAPITDVLKFTLEHLDAAEALGPGWLAREQQDPRTSESRRVQRRRYIRAMQSSILGMMGNHGAAWQQGADEKLGTLDVMYAKG